MQVEKNMVVTLDYNVTDPEGTVVDPGSEPMEYLHGGYGDIFEKIEEMLEGHQIGDSISVKLQPEEAFGEYDPELVQVENRSMFPDELQVGMLLEGAPESPEDGDEDDVIIYRVTEIAENSVVLDGNHPLAGSALIFNCTITAIRKASRDEIRQGQVAPQDEGTPTCH